MDEELSGDRSGGVRSGEICVRVQREALLDGAARGLAPALAELALAPPTLAQMTAPWTRKVEALRRRRQQLQERRRLVRQRYDATRAAMDAVARDPESSLEEATSSVAAAVDTYGAVFQSLAQLYARHAMGGVLQYYALLEEERHWIAAWQRKEAARCQELVRAAKRRHHLSTLAVHLESETSGQIRLRRLPEGDAQRARCLKAASENVKKGFFHTSPDDQEHARTRIEVMDVYKIDNAPLLRAFEQWITRHTAPTETAKVKGLFCAVPAESLERCVAWGMFRDEEAMASSLGGVDQPIFNRPNWDIAKSEAPGTQRRFVAQRRVQEATPMAFPRRFSRYSTLNELRDAPSSDRRLSDAPTRYLALCRVAMGKTQRVVGTNAAPDFPSNASVASLFFSEDEEYVARYPEAVVPEFLVEYRFTRPAPVDPESATSADRLIPVRLSGPSREPLPSVAFEASAKTLMDDLLREQSSRTASQPLSLLTQLTSIPSVFGPVPAAPTIGLIPASHNDEELSTEKVLEICGRRRRIYADDLQQLRGLLWETTKRAWDTIDIPTRQTRSMLKPQREDERPRQPTENQRPEIDEKPTKMAKRQSFKAKKLYGELALERQLQANDVARLDALVKSKLSLNGKFKKKDGVANRPRPFR